MNHNKTPSFSLVFLPLVIFVFMKLGEIHHGERYKLVIEHNVLEMLLIEQPIAHSYLAKCLGSGYLRSDAGPASPLLWQPVQSRDIRSQV